MLFGISSALLDALVLSVASDGETYGYEITQTLRKSVDVSESTLYPVLRRLQKDECLSVYDKEFSGRNRRYYALTPKGRSQLSLYREEWKLYRDKVQKLLEGGVKDDQNSVAQ
ncbi:MAG: PadR family transcriptional regulator [Clostridia bacterium]|nr:PadR family transcriptional regulator [Clostridia bacterium]